MREIDQVKIAIILISAFFGLLIIVTIFQVSEIKNQLKYMPQGVCHNETITTQLYNVTPLGLVKLDRKDSTSGILCNKGNCIGWYLKEVCEVK